MSIEFYKVLHICGILMLFTGLAGLWGTYASGSAPKKFLRVVLSIIHGVGMLLLMISGFGLAAKLELTGSLPLWLYLKMAIWLALGGSMVLAKRKALWGARLIGLWVTLGVLAAYLALFKPV